MKSKPIKPRRGQESVWDYPRPPRLERTGKRLRVVVNGVTIADTTRGWRVLETSHAPVYYIPPEDVRREFVIETSRTSHCEWKGKATHYGIAVGHRRLELAAWAYPAPVDRFSSIKDHFAFYAGPMDKCTVDGEEVRAQPGRFYGGWITDDVVGPCKGDPGTEGW